MQNVHESPKIEHLPFGGKRNQTQPIKRKQKSLTETPGAKEKRLIARCEYEKRRRVNESEESKEKRLAQQGLKMKKKRASECSESRKKRLVTQSQYQRQKIANESAECREERLFNQRQYQKGKIANESAENRQERLAKQHQYQNEKYVFNPTITDEIRKFYACVSYRGQEYICSCCNQLWLQHNVITAEKLRLSIYSIAGKYLLSKTSVDGIEWMCQSCYRHLKKDKISPCAAKNGMSFPEKPDYFDLNELECRMLAPRVAFQKLLQAPRGNQFKKKRKCGKCPSRC